MDLKAERARLDAVAEFLDETFGDSGGEKYVLLIARADGDRMHVHAVTDLPPPEAWALMMKGAERMMAVIDGEAN